VTTPIINSTNVNATTNVTTPLIQAGDITITTNAISTTNVNEPINLTPNGTGAVKITNSTNSVPLQFYDKTGINYISLQSPDQLLTSTALKLPNSDGQQNQYLSTNGNGTLGWASPGAFMIGMIMAWPLNNVVIPSGFLYCDGSLLLITAYPKLFAIIGITYGGDGITTFALPDLRTRTIFGYSTNPSSTSTFKTVPATGGIETKTLSTTELPSHSHSFSSSINGGSVSGTATVSVPGRTGYSDSVNSEFCSASTSGTSFSINATGSISGTVNGSVSGTTNGAGSSGAFSIMPNYAIMTWVIFAGF